MIGTASVLMMFYFQMIFSSVGVCVAVAVRSFCGLKFRVFYLFDIGFITQSIFREDCSPKTGRPWSGCDGILWLSYRRTLRGYTWLCWWIPGRSSTACLSTASRRQSFPDLQQPTLVGREHVSRLVKCLLYQQDCDKKTNNWRRLSVWSSRYFCAIV